MVYQYLLPDLHSPFEFTIYKARMLPNRKLLAAPVWTYCSERRHLYGNERPFRNQTEVAYALMLTCRLTREEVRLIVYPRMNLHVFAFKALEDLTRTFAPFTLALLRRLRLRELTATTHPIELCDLLPRFSSLQEVQLSECHVKNQKQPAQGSRFAGPTLEFIKQLKKSCPQLVNTFFRMVWVLVDGTPTLFITSEGTAMENESPVDVEEEYQKSLQLVDESLFRKWQWEPRM